jgi:hypothetical protein
VRWLILLLALGFAVAADAQTMPWEPWPLTVPPASGGAAATSGYPIGIP